MEKKLKWKNLLRNRCPQCSRGDLFGLNPGIISCKESCGFVISEKRMEEIVNDMNLQKLQDTGEPYIYEGPGDREDDL